VEGGSTPAPPNFLLIITDDQRVDSVCEYMPQTQARVFDEGVTFPRAYVTTPLCCPSRASLLTGLYAHNHGVKRNPDPLKRRTFVEALHDAGYTTAMVGKYLNSWDGEPRSEFDFWVSHAPSQAYYRNPRLNVNGEWILHKGYTTYILRDYALSFLDSAAGGSAPFLLILAGHAPHAPANPPPPDRDLYPDLPPLRPPNFNEPDVADKPRWLQQTPPLSEEQVRDLDEFRRRQLQTLWSLDQSIGALLDRLAMQGRLDDTVVVFLSDNGLLLGEHRLDNKVRVYEKSIQTPLAIRYPRVFRAGAVDERLVANIDLAPTILELAGLPVPADANGRSLAPRRSTAGWRTALLIEAWPDDTAYAAAHTGDAVYVETEGDLAEYYDLRSDPYQLANRAGDSTVAAEVERMRQRLQGLRVE
jgi:arylsulfatase A-like enzyme